MPNHGDTIDKRNSRAAWQTRAPAGLGTQNHRRAWHSQPQRRHELALFGASATVLLWIAAGRFRATGIDGRDSLMGGRTLNAIKLVAIALIVAGALGLAYGGFSYTKDTTAVKLGSVELSVKEKETVNVPIWAGIAAIVAGGLLLVFSGKTR